MTEPGGGGRRRQVALVAAAVIGVGLALAPVGFAMFERAPRGGEMLDGFRPHMDDETITAFRGHLARIDATAAELDGPARELVGTRLGEGLEAFPALVSFEERWDDEIGPMLTTMLDDIEANLDRFAAVDALPPFALFPWFFVVPGLIAAGAGVGALRSRPGGAGDRTLRGVLALLGAGLLVAPGIFGMFERAPAGEAMIDDLRPLMTREHLGAVQDAFLVIGGAEGALRNGLLPALADAGMSGDERADALPASTELVAAWPAMAAEMAPMIGAISDHLGDFEAVDALPPFGLFPWFFVAPGALLFTAALVADPGTPRQVTANPTEPALTRRS